MTISIKARNKDHLSTLIQEHIKVHGSECDLNHIDVSGITDMSNVFEKSSFNGDISRWDVSGVVDMSRMFLDAHFNGDISQWDVSNVTNMSEMFRTSHFNQTISSWKPSLRCCFHRIFWGAKFQKPLFPLNNFWANVSNAFDYWHPSTIGVLCHLRNYDAGEPLFLPSAELEEFKYLAKMYCYSPSGEEQTELDRFKHVARRFLSRPIAGEVPQKNCRVVANTREHLREIIMECIARDGDQCDLNHINVSKITNFKNLFKDTLFNGDISRWNVSNAVCMDSMFENTPFNGDISRWNVQKLQYAARMFKNTLFEGDLSQWQPYELRDARSMFEHSNFCGNIASWRMEHLLDAERMFFDSPLAKHASPFELGEYVNQYQMTDAHDIMLVPGHKQLRLIVRDALKQHGLTCDLNYLDVSRVTDFSHLFEFDNFQGNISGWDVSNGNRFRKMFKLFHDSPLGYVAYFQGDVTIPAEHPLNGVLEQEKNIGEALGLPLSQNAAYIYSKLHDVTDEQVADFSEFTLC